MRDFLRQRGFEGTLRAFDFELKNPPEAQVKLRRQQEIDAVGAASDLGVDPGKIDLELLGAVSDRSEHTEAAGTRHGGHDVSAVTEGEDRKLAPEQFGDRSLQGHQALGRTMVTVP